MELALFQDKSRKWQVRCVDELKLAPDRFKGAFKLLSEGEYSAAEQYYSTCAIDDGLWYYAAQAIVAFLQNQRGDHRAAIASAKCCRPLDLPLSGCYYYYYALTDSLNQMDCLMEALTVIDEAIDYFDREDSPSNLANYHFRKANILKQMASPLSRNLEQHSQNIAKELIVESIKNICESLQLYSEGWASDSGLISDLKSIAAIAARVGVKKENLIVLNGMDEIGMLTEQYFSSGGLAGQTLAECFKMAVEEIKMNSRNEAALWYDRGLQAAPLENPEDRAMKAFVAYQAGVNLLKLHGLENNNLSVSRETYSTAAVDMIRRYWKQALDLYSELNPETIAEFDKKWPPGLSIYAWNIKRDPLMRSE